MKQLYELIRKEIADYYLSDDEIFFQTQCGKTIRIHSTELKGWSSFSFSYDLEKRLDERYILDISIYPNEIVFYFVNGSREYLFTSGINKIVDVKKSDNGLELLLILETNSGREIAIHYFKTSNRWTMAEFNQHTEQEYLDLAKKYDLVNHPSIRIKTLI